MAELQLGLLESHFHSLCDKDPDLSILWAQWSFDKELNIRALQGVANVFPHYSRHDASHARQIISNIERILGDTTIEKLSASDAWLILSAAYSHDTGMVVPYEEKIRIWKDTAFHNLLNELKQNPIAELHPQAKQVLEVIRGYEGPKETTWPVELTHAVTLLTAEFVRRQHAQKAAEYIQNPERIGSPSPRTGLVPQRFFYLLGEVCEHHGKTFDEVMELPHRQASLGREHLHPRFVACLLRMGDLLDLDDNRFCPMMVKLGGPLPATSKAHQEKHASIRHFRLDHKRIEIEAECSSVESYQETQIWFDWIKQELENQRANWLEIVPDNGLSPLPTLGTRKVNIKGKTLLDNKEAPKFTIDTEQAFQLFTGAGIYENKYEAIRELMQNAVDATLLRAWQDLSIQKPENWGKEQVIPEITYDGFREHLEQYPLHVRIEKEKEDKDGNIIWLFEIADMGTGMLVEDIKYVQTIAGSSKNPTKAAIKESMPLWARPSGEFGLGLQSSFLLTDKITFLTCGAAHATRLKIEMKKSQGMRGGDIIIEEEANSSNKYQRGTVTQLRIVAPKIPEEKDLDYLRKPYQSKIDLIQHFDPITDQQLDAVYFSLAEQATQFSNLSPVPIHINGKALQRKKSSALWFDKKTNWAVAPEFTLGDFRWHFGGAIHFKGQALQIPGFSFNADFLTGNFDILGENAGRLLQINREKLRANAIDEVRHTMIHSSFHWLEEHWRELQKNETNFQAASIFYWNYKSLLPENSPLRHNTELIHAWEQVTLKTSEDKEGSTTMILGDLFSEPSLSWRIHKHLFPHEDEEEEIFFKFNETEYKFDGNSAFKFIIQKLLMESSYHVQSIACVNRIGDDNEFNHDWQDEIIQFTKTACTPDISQEYQIWHIRKAFDIYRTSQRQMFPVIEPFDTLAVTKATPFVKEYYNQFLQKQCLSPFIFEIDQTRRDDRIFLKGVEQVIDWAFEHRANTTVTREQMRAKYIELIHYIEDLMKDDPFWTENRKTELDEPLPLHGNS